MAYPVAGQRNRVAGNDEFWPVVIHCVIVSELASDVSLCDFVGDLNIDAPVAALRRHKVYLLAMRASRADCPSASYKFVVDDRLVKGAIQVVHKRLLVLDEGWIADINLVVKFKRGEADDIESGHEGRDAGLGNCRKMV